MSVIYSGESILVYGIYGFGITLKCTLFDHDRYLPITIGHRLFTTVALALLMTNHQPGDVGKQLFPALTTYLQV